MAMQPVQVIDKHDHHWHEINEYIADFPFPLPSSERLQLKNEAENKEREKEISRCAGQIELA